MDKEQVEILRRAIREASYKYGDYEEARKAIYLIAQAVVEIDHFPIESLRRLLDHTHTVEERNFQNTGAPKRHIFRDIETLSIWEYKNRKGR